MCFVVVSFRAIQNKIKWKFNPSVPLAFVPYSFYVLILKISQQEQIKRIKSSEIFNKQTHKSHFVNGIGSAHL